ncbi:MAG TPA: hypothetical protein VNX68_13190 [Nitrosopumilaceae archaeon]|jgi:hypothetical protein|nr:hypothetical protein [Nitrosopumilaceae archaeon]
MTIKDLIEHLQQFPDDSLEVMILDGFNGGGRKRTINYMPPIEKIQEHGDDTGADCDGRDGEQVVVLGFGCY